MGSCSGPQDLLLPHSIGFIPNSNDWTKKHVAVQTQLQGTFRSGLPALKCRSRSSATLHPLPGFVAQADRRKKLPAWLLLATVVLSGHLGAKASLQAEETSDSASGYAVSSVPDPAGLVAPGAAESGAPGGPASPLSLDTQPETSILWVNPWSESGDAESPAPARAGQGLEAAGAAPDEATDDMVQFLGYASVGETAPGAAPHRLTLLSDMLWGAGDSEGAAPAPTENLAMAKGLGMAFPATGRLMETLAQIPNATMFQTLLAFAG